VERFTLNKGAMTYNLQPNLKGVLVLFNSRKKTEETAAEEAKKSETANAAAENAAVEETAAAAPEESAGEKQEGANVDILQKALDASKADLEKIRKDFEQLTDARLRLAAEYDNFRKRSQREKDAIYADSTASAVAALLPVIDNIERALAAENASAEDLRKGVEMIGTQAAQAFEKLGVTPFGAVGETFDPNLHHCVSAVDTEEVKSGEIAMVLQKGYKLGDKVIRPAMVQVAN
jgi:Molecular chaperone GrpE (heat shock protein)